MDTLELLAERHSVRSYSVEPLKEDIFNSLRSEVTYINTHEAGLNLQLCLDQPDAFAGLSRSYGFFRNVRNYLACVIDPTFDFAMERAACNAEQFVMFCVEKGLGTCFVGGTFSRKHVAAQVEVYEKIPFVVTFGIPDEKHTSVLVKGMVKMMHRNKKRPRDFFEGTEADYADACRLIPDLERGLEAIALAPSALNKQPVRLRLDHSGESPRLIAVTGDYEKFAADLGIAKYNFSAVIPGFWDWGEAGAFNPE